MRTDKLTTRFQAALSDAQSIAVGHDNQFIEAMHVLLVLLEQDSSTVSQILTSTGVNVNALKSKINEALEGWVVKLKEVYETEIFIVQNDL